MPIVLSNAALAGSYDYGLVVLSVLIAMLASYAALDLAGRLTAARGRVRFTWFTGGSATMGLGIWAMHYIGMLALNLPSRSSTIGQRSCCLSWQPCSHRVLACLS